jgi:hypothetical protein
VTLQTKTAEDAYVGVDDHLNFTINPVVSAENTCLKCCQLTGLLETSQKEVKSLHLAVKLLQRDSEQLTFKGRMLDTFNAACTLQLPNFRYI